MNNEQHNLSLEASFLMLDDEELALSYSQEILTDVIKDNKFFSHYKVRSTTNQQDFWSILKTHRPAIIFLDIEMPNKNGIEIANEIRMNSSILGYPENLPLIIFSTAYDQYGYKAFQVGAINYLLKPFSEENIQDLLDNLEKTQHNNLKIDVETIKVPASGIDIDLPLKEVLYFNADMKYIAVQTDKKEFLINDTLLNLEQKYPNFVKIHRAYLVNPIYINKFFRKDNHWFLSLKNHDKHLPVSRRQRQEIEGKLNYYDLFNND